MAVLKGRYISDGILKFIMNDNLGGKAYGNGKIRGCVGL